MAENNEIKDDEIITVELGQEGAVKSVEEEIADVTPTEAPVDEDVSEAPTDAPSEEPTDSSEEDSEDSNAEESSDEKVEEDKNSEQDSSVKKEGEADTTSSDKPSEEKESDESEKVEEEPTEPPVSDEDDELAKARAEIAQLKEAQETQQIVENINKTAVQVEAEVNRFDVGLSKALKETFEQYNIDLNKTLDELKEDDPAKFAIAQELINHAENIRAQRVAELQAPLVEAQKAYIFREASKAMCQYEMTEEQANEAANTFVNIMNQTGIKDIENDLKAKVELSVARAKMIIPNVTKEEVKVENKVEEQVKEEPTEVPTDAPTEAPTEAVEDVKEEPVVDLEAFKESAAEGDAIVNNREGVTVDNVIQKLNSLPFKERTAFYKEYEDLIRQAGIQTFKNQGLK
jgi:hypothetical protein